MSLFSNGQRRSLIYPHQLPSLQVALTFSEGFKLVYTGDTRPTEDLRELGKAGGKQTDLLIHEATAEHAMIVDCTIKKHSTFVEAIEDGKKMDAKFTLLTHFSQVRSI